MKYFLIQNVLDNVYETKRVYIILLHKEREKHMAKCTRVNQVKIIDFIRPMDAYKFSS